MATQSPRFHAATKLWAVDIGLLEDPPQAASAGTNMVATKTTRPAFPVARLRTADTLAQADQPGTIA